MPAQSLFTDLIKMLQSVNKPQDVSPELIQELKGLATVLTFQFFLAQRADKDSLTALEDTRAHFNTYFDQIKKDIAVGGNYQL